MRICDEQFSASFGKRFRIEERIYCRCGGDGLGWLLNPGGGSTTPDVPDASQLGRQDLELTDAFRKGVPNILGAEQQYKPAFVDTALGALSESVAGTSTNPGLLTDVER